MLFTKVLKQLKVTLNLARPNTVGRLIARPVATCRIQSCDHS